MWSSCEGQDELCPVCGDKVSGYHYGLLTCESCKGFFKRSVQNQKEFSCLDQQRCTVNKTQRRRCPACRFNKCLLVGMRLEAVRADRTRGGRNVFGPMYKRDKEQRKALLLQGGRFGVATPGCPGAPRDQRPSPLGWPAAAASGPAGPPPPRPPLPPPPPPPMRAFQQYSSSSTCGPLCLMADQMLRSVVGWARTSTFFMRLQVWDQMKLLHRCWSSLLLLDLVSSQVHCGKESRLLLLAGQQVDLSQVLSHAGPVESSLIQRGRRLAEKLLLLQVDRRELACIKVLVLFSPADMAGLEEAGFILSVRQQAEAALLDSALLDSALLDSALLDSALLDSALLDSALLDSALLDSALLDCALCSGQSRSALLLQAVAELRRLSVLVEDYLYRKHLSSELCCNNLLSEMLHAKLGCDK